MPEVEGNLLKKDTTYRVGDDKIRLQEIILVIGQAGGKGGRYANH